MYRACVSVVALFALGASAHTADVIAVRQVSMELASDIATQAILNCRVACYRVTAVVGDRSGYPQVVMRDVLASRFTREIAEKKANPVILSRVSSSELRKKTAMTYVWK